MMHIIAKRWDTPSVSSGGTLDESLARAELSRAVARLVQSAPRERVKLRARIVSLQHELARALERSGREHLASALWTSDDFVED
jgi:hypothetical protein